jgi:ribosome-dependent ATPase
VRKGLSSPARKPGNHAIVTARELTCCFGDFTAVDRVSFNIERREIFGFLGPNRCGKTTLAQSRRLHVAVVLALS